jgi:hypothetical protein
MFIVNLIKFESMGEGIPQRRAFESIREANAVHVKRGDHGHISLQLGDAPGETMEVTIGSKPECSYSVAIVMNSSGKTVETIR